VTHGLQVIADRSALASSHAVPQDTAHLNKRTISWLRSAERPPTGSRSVGFAA